MIGQDERVQEPELRYCSSSPQKKPHGCDSCYSHKDDHTPFRHGGDGGGYVSDFQIIEPDVVIHSPGDVLHPDPLGYEARWHSGGPLHRALVQPLRLTGPCCRVSDNREGRGGEIFRID